MFGCKGGIGIVEYRKPKTQPEHQASNTLVNYMRGRGWGIWKIGGGRFTVGWPDFYAFHPEYGERWIEMKTPTGKLRASQIKRFINMSKHGVRIWVLTSYEQYMKLFQTPNWRQYR